MKQPATRITTGFRKLPVSRLGDENPLPKFRFQMGGVSAVASGTLSTEERDGFWKHGEAIPMLPYLTQDGYDRSQRLGRMASITLENACLRAIFYPTLGGRLMSLYDKKQRRELLFDNPVFQPANLAIRNAWFSGGIEWNAPLLGHTAVTCCPIFFGVVETERGPILRLYEFDRLFETTWRVDVFLPADSDKLWVHVKVQNPNPHDLDYYWWTNLAVPSSDKTRVLAPADYAISHGQYGNTRIPFPYNESKDWSYPSNVPHADSIFFRKPGHPRPWVAYCDETGRGMMYSSTRTLSARKFFVWGHTPGGQHWQDFLAKPGRGNYLEIQGGVAPTQLQTFPLKADASLEWTECFQSFELPKRVAHHRDFQFAAAQAEKQLVRDIPDKSLAAMDTFLAAHSDAPITQLLHHGAPWGFLYEKRTGNKLSRGLIFDGELTDDAWPWAEMLMAGTFSKETLAQTPRSWNTSAGWRAALEASASANGATWLHHLHLGVAELEAGKFERAHNRFLASIALKDNVMARRNLALLQERSGEVDAAHGTYLRAWSLMKSVVARVPSRESDGMPQETAATTSGGLSHGLSLTFARSLAVEIAEFLRRHNKVEAFDSFLATLPTAIRNHERIQLAAAWVALARDDVKFVAKVLEHEFVTVREGELSLTDLWFALEFKREEKKRGRALSAQEKDGVMARSRPPKHLNFIMGVSQHNTVARKKRK